MNIAVIFPAPRQTRGKAASLLLAALFAVMAGCSGSPVGKPAPAFELKDRTGKVCRLADLAGHPAVVYFWSTWAPPSRLGITQMTRLQAAYPRKDLAVVAIAVRDDGRQVARFLKDTRVNFPVLLGTTTVEDAWFGPSGPRLPTVFLLDAHGRIAAVFAGYQRKEDLAPAVEKVVAEAGK